MSAELYDAEMAGALARPAIDVLPSHHARKDKGPEVAAEAAPAADLPETPLEPTLEAAPTEPVAEAFAAPVLEAAPADEAISAIEPVAEAPTPRKVFGMSLTRARKPKADEAPSFEPVAITDDAIADSAIEAVAEPVALEDAPVADLAPLADPPTDAPAKALVPAAEIVGLAPAMPDHTEEVRAMRALLEASEQVRQAAEARTEAAESQLRTVTNSVQEWQIRHREAEATITELAGSVAGAEGRMAELHSQLSALQAERDELVSQLDAATSPVTS